MGGYALHLCRVEFRCTWSGNPPYGFSRHRALRQELRDLDRVQRGALQELIGGNEHRDRVTRGVAEILADAADPNVVLARGIDRHREIVLRAVIHDLHARRAGQQLADVVLADRPFAFEGDGLGVRAQHRNADAGDADGDLLVLEDLAGFLDDLGLFAVVTGRRIDLGVVAEEVEGVGMRQHLWRVAVPLEAGAGRFHKLVHRGGDGAARGLVGRDALVLYSVLGGE